MGCGVCTPLVWSPFHNFPFMISLRLLRCNIVLSILQDGSGLWGMHTSTEGEVFDPLEAEAAALWDIDDVEVERLRAAPEGSHGEAEGALHTPGSHLTGEKEGGTAGA